MPQDIEIKFTQEVTQETPVLIGHVGMPRSGENNITLIGKNPIYQTPIPYSMVNHGAGVYVLEQRPDLKTYATSQCDLLETRVGELYNYAISDIASIRSGDKNADPSGLVDFYNNLKLFTCEDKRLQEVGSLKFPSPVMAAG